MQSLNAAHNTSLHVAALIQRKKVVKVATNRIGSRSRGAGYSDCTIHAERNALKDVDHACLNGAILVVVRLNTKKELIGSKPCKDCEQVLRKFMKSYGLRAVYYS